VGVFTYLSVCLSACVFDRLWHCWLCHLTREVMSEITCVSSGTLNPAIPTFVSRLKQTGIAAVTMGVTDASCPWNPTCEKPPPPWNLAVATSANRIWNNTNLRSPKQQIWLRTALCGGWCRRMAPALHNLRVACQKWRRPRPHSSCHQVCHLFPPPWKLPHPVKFTLAMGTYSWRPERATVAWKCKRGPVFLGRPTCVVAIFATQLLYMWLK